MRKCFFKSAILVFFSFITLSSRAQFPVVTDFSPKSGTTGTHVLISGLHFLNADKVGFGLFPIPSASFTVLSDTQIDAVVGSGFSGPVAVHNPDGWGALEGFVFPNDFRVTSFAPTTGPVGTIVTISGVGFSLQPQENRVRFGNAAAIVTEASATQLKVAVPVGADNGLLTVSKGTLTATAGQAFTIQYPAASRAILPGSFAAAVTLPVAAAPDALIASDIDGDGKTDLLISNAATPHVGVLLNTSTKAVLSYATESVFTLPEPAGNIAAGDLDGDGKPDLVGCGPTMLTYRLNTSMPSSVSFAPAQVIPPGFGVCKVRITDFNGDGRQDILLNNSAQAFVLLNIPNTDTSFTFVMSNVNRLPDYTGTPGFDFVDLDGDSKPEMVVTSPLNNIVEVFPNFSTPTSVSQTPPYQIYATGKAPMDGVVFADVDADGKMDIVTCNSGDGTVGVLLNTSSASGFSFRTTAYVSPTGIGLRHLAMTDLNGDGLPEAIVTDNTGGHGSTVSVLPNGSVPGFSNLQLPVSYPAGEGSAEIVCIDIDNDGKQDFVVANAVAGTLTLYRNRMDEADLVASGLHPVTGQVKNEAYFDNAVRTFNGIPLVQRHYEITPVSDAANATATVTLFFSQADFDHFNSYVKDEPFLPASGSDAAHIANIRVIQYHGFSATGEPGANGAGPVIIDPDDDKVIWNPVALRWEVTFDVNGFSGFFVSNVVNANLPLKLLKFTVRQVNAVNILQWVVADAVNVDRFEIERSSNGIAFDFAGVQKWNQNAAVYQWREQTISAAVTYYRLRIVDTDGKSELSKVVKVENRRVADLISLLPNPVSINSVFTLVHPVETRTTSIEIRDVEGRCLRIVKAEPGTFATVVSTSGLIAGTYVVVWQGSENLTYRMIVR